VFAHLPILQVVVPLLAAPLVGLLRRGTLAWTMTTAASLTSFVIALTLVERVRQGDRLTYALGAWPAPYGIELSVDALSGLLLLIITGASTTALLACKASLERQIDAERRPLLYATWLLALAGLVGIVVSGDAFNIFVFMEISSLATYVLIASGPQRAALPAVFKYLVMGTIGATFYLIGVGLVYMLTGTLNLADMQMRLQESAELRPVLVACGFITIGLALKAAVFPLHGWLPNAYAFAPHAVTVFIAGCSTKVALYVLLRFDFVVFQGNLERHAVQFTGFILPLAIIAMLAASVRALFEHDVKRILAYSSVAQVGYILLGASLLSFAGLKSSLLHLFNHSLAKATLFLAIAALAMSGMAHSLEGVKGAARRMPVTMAVFVVAGLSLIGVPGTAGFVSKWYLVLAALELGWIGAWLAVPMLVSSVLAVGYVWRIVEPAYFGETSGRAVVAEAPRWMLAVLLLAGLANLYFGLDPDLPLELVEAAAGSLLE